MRVQTQTSTETCGYVRAPLHSSRVRTLVLAGLEKNADKADIIFGLLRGL